MNASVLRVGGWVLALISLPSVSYVLSHCSTDGADLGIAEDTSTGGPMITLRELKVRNRGRESGTAVVVVSMVDSMGTVIGEAMSHSGTTVVIPAASLGGRLGAAVPMPDADEFREVAYRLAYAGLPFGLRATVRTAGGDSDEGDNTGTREFRPWLPIAPGTSATVRFAFLVPSTVRGARARLTAMRRAPHAHVGDAGACEQRLLAPGPYSCDVQVFAPTDLKHGALIAIRLSLLDLATGAVLQEHERIALYDTVPPALTSYRAILLRDGRLAIQVHASDRDAGVPEGGVVTRYSIDGGSTWHRQVHSFIEDDFGRPALFEIVLGPFARGTEILLGIRAQDRVGNTTSRMPVDATVLLAPARAEVVLDSLDFSHTEGHPLFAPEAVLQQARWVAAGAAESAAVGRNQSVSDPRGAAAFEARRISELDQVPAAFRRWRVNAAHFKRVEARPMGSSADSAPLQVIVRPW